MLRISRRTDLSSLAFHGIFLTCNFILGLSIVFSGGKTISAAVTNDAQEMLNQNASVSINNELASQVNNIMPLAVTAAEITHSGTSGTANWDIDSNGKLTIHAGQLAYGKGSWSPYASNIKSVYVDTGVSPALDILTADANNSVFSELPNVITIDVTNLDVSKTHTFGRMFAEDPKLTNIIGLDTWDTSSTQWMNNMFNKDSSLTSIDLSSFNTSKVTWLIGMFNDCTALESLDVSNFDTSSVTDLSNTFQNVPGKIIGLEKFDTSKVLKMSGTFRGVDFTKTDANDIKDWDVSAVTDMSYLFQKSKFDSLDLSSWNIGNVANMAYMFANDSNVNKVKNLANWDTKNVTNMLGMFQAVSDTDLSFVENWDVSNVTNAGYMFDSCPNLTSLDLSKWHTDSLVSTASMFNGDKLLNENTLQGYQTLVIDKNTSVASMFNGTSFQVIDLSKYDTSNVTDFTRFLSGTSKLEKIIGNFDMHSAKNLSYMFFNSHITDFGGLNIADWDMSNATNLQNIFDGLKMEDFSFIKDWNVSSVTTMSGMFANNSVVKYLPVEKWDVSKVNSLYSFVYNDTNLVDLPVENWNVSKVTSFSQMFFEASAIKSLDLSKWDTSSGTNFYAMFNTMTNLEILDISSFDTTKATNINYMLGGGNRNLWKITLGPKTVLIDPKAKPTDMGARLLSPTPGTLIKDNSTTTQYSAISDRWQEVNEVNGGTNHSPVGDLVSGDDIMNKFATTDNPVTTYVWQQQTKQDLSMEVPDLDFGTVSGVSGLVHRKTKDFGVTVNNNNYPNNSFDTDLTVSMDKPLTASDNQTMDDVLVYRDENNVNRILSDSPMVVYDGKIDGGKNNISWDDSHGLLLDMNNDKYAKNGNYSTTLTWNLTNSL